ncbi:hypothetical protein TNIN_242921 [Trichonephila inaurata madagascariensis]|uniref:Uncharacterized protein n=1 Tax=Trichonephila inaurata madagascariensis TaxID=2747483 RepID=A0A8X6XCM4_9ARAC|nr:hypothetical protein TNIN_242921 [Trichonephila inaurata madagascariensis]
MKDCQIWEPFPFLSLLLSNQLFPKTNDQYRQREGLEIFQNFFKWLRPLSTERQPFSSTPLGLLETPLFSPLIGWGASSSFTGVCLHVVACVST